MLHPGRRSAISISELGLYFDRSDRYRKNHYNSIVRKFVIGVMVLITVILVAVFLYDFTSATSSNKISQETKHIYVLQNALRKGPTVSKKAIDPKTTSETTVLPIENYSYDENTEDILSHQNETSDQVTEEASMEHMIEAESRSQNPSNFKLRKRLLKSIDDRNDEEDGPENKQLFNNHAMIYRIKQRYKPPESEEEDDLEDRKPMPFHWEYRTPHPSSFKRVKFPQLTQYRYPHASRNIQDIIKYLTNDAVMPSRGVKFTGIYVNPKKYDVYPEIAEATSNSDRSEEFDDSYYSTNYNGDPFYQYKPKHPSDVNLLATSNVRFSPAGINRYNPYYDPYFARPSLTKPPLTVESQLQNAYISNYQKRKKPQPFSVMLDIYPITDIVEQNKQNGKPKVQIPLEDYDIRRPIQFNRGHKFYSSNSQPIPIVAVPNQQALTDEEERQQMIFHLNLYPRKKNKLSRHELIHRSENMGPEERQEMVKKIMTPLESIAKHLTDHSSIENSKQEEDQEDEEIVLPTTHLQEKVLTIKDEKNANDTDDRTELSESSIIPSNHKSSLEEDYASTEKYEYEAQKIIVTTTSTTAINNEYSNRENTTTTENTKIINISTDIDTLEGFERFDRTRTN
ncbi:PREDICTED: uncharacterized protein LOC106787828 [Polistes canadensis]|uniref:uncharacterized protein LOC106787828 n=1 Tax=Polistes canadensis TaxID=91411 RepID=UPI000718B9F8|nr:PREDICTED: uncharacterized protein LOC106787828 [Polistes canadensis]